jgi:hypothetical protein
MPGSITCECGNVVWTEDNPSQTPVTCPYCGAVTKPPVTSAEPDVVQPPGAPDAGPIAVQTLFYCRCFPRVPVVHVLVFVGSVALAVYVHYIFWIAAGMSLVSLFCWMALATAPRDGIPCPGRVVATDPFLVAVYSDLRVMSEGASSG